MRGEAGGPTDDGPETTVAVLRGRVAELRLELLRLRASRRTLIALLERESRERRLLEARLERLRARLRGERARRRALSVASGDGR